MKLSFGWLRQLWAVVWPVAAQAGADMAVKKVTKKGQSDAK